MKDINERKNNSLFKNKLKSEFNFLFNKQFFLNLLSKENNLQFIDNIIIYKNSNK